MLWRIPKHSGEEKKGSFGKIKISARAICLLIQTFISPSLIEKINYV